MSCRLIHAVRLWRKVCLGEFKMSMTTRLCLWRCGFHLTDLLHLLHLTSLISFLSSLFYLSDSLPFSPQHLFFFSESENTARVLLCDFCLVCLNLERLNEFMHASVFNGASLFSENARGREPARTVECVCVFCPVGEWCSDWHNACR